MKVDKGVKVNKVLFYAQFQRPAFFVKKKTDLCVFTVNTVRTWICIIDPWPANDDITWWKKMFDLRRKRLSIWISKSRKSPLEGSSKSLLIMQNASPSPLTYFFAHLTKNNLYIFTRKKSFFNFSDRKISTKMMFDDSGPSLWRDLWLMEVYGSPEFYISERGQKQKLKAEKKCWERCHAGSIRSTTSSNLL